MRLVGYCICVCLIGVVASEISLHAVLHAKWSNFKATHGKDYHPSEEHHRLQTFLQNALHVETHNERFAKGLESYELSHNKFSDMTEDEVVRKRTGFKIPPPEHNCNNTVVDETSFPMASNPPSVDWRKYTPVIHNQGECGSCYAFSAVGAMEGVMARKHEQKTGQLKTFNLSEQELVDCSKKYGNDGCDGGFMNTCFKYARDKKGISTKNAYRYTGKVGTCNANIAKEAGSVVTRSIDVAPKESALTAALASVGPIAVAVHAGNKGFMMYSSGVFDDIKCDPKQTDHAVLAVGYGTANGKDYYLVKNSWGTDWGEGGYIRIARNRCGVADFGTYPAY